jgi:hypothetical protein
VLTIMAAPRPQFGEAGEASVEALVPPLVWVRMAKAGDITMEAYRERYTRTIAEEDLRPGSLLASDGVAVAAGDTLICACSREAAANGRCHRVWAGELLSRAGWSVVLDGQAFEPAADAAKESS